MKWGVLVAMLALGGCASVTDIEHTIPTLNVISGKKPDAYAQCNSCPKLETTHRSSRTKMG